MRVNFDGLAGKSPSPSSKFLCEEVGSETCLGTTHVSFLGPVILVLTGSEVLSTCQTAFILSASLSVCLCFARPIHHSSWGLRASVSTPFMELAPRDTKTMRNLPANTRNVRVDHSENSGFRNCSSFFGPLVGYLLFTFPLPVPFYIVVNTCTGAGRGTEVLLILLACELRQVTWTLWATVFLEWRKRWHPWCNFCSSPSRV